MPAVEAFRPIEREPETRNYWEKVERLQERGNYVSVGLDSDWSKIPGEYKALGREEGTFQFNKEIIDATADLVCTYKPNVAFYLDSEEGEKALARTVGYIHERYPHIPVTADAKVGDIGNTTEGWKRMLFDRFKFDATTVNPYLGSEAIKPFLDEKDKGIIVVCKTSNPGSGEFQDLPIPIDRFTTDVNEMVELMHISGKTDIPLYLAVANRVSRHWNKNKNCALVVGATYPAEAEQIRSVDSHMPFLVPAIGEQGGDLQKAVAASMDINAKGMMINSSRGIIFAQREKYPNGEVETVGQAARRATLKLRNEINYYRENPEGMTDTQKELAHALLELGAIKFGAFKLKLHEKQPNAPLSPIYVDLRLLRSAPPETQLLACKAYLEMIKDLPFDAYADTPTAVTPIVAILSNITNVPMITPRGEKRHGSGAQIDGIFERGKTTAVAIDDVITSGQSAIDAIEVLRSGGVNVRDFVALVNREQGGVDAIKAEGVNVHYAYTLSNMLRFYHRKGMIDESTYRKTISYLAPK